MGEGLSHLAAVATLELGGQVEEGAELVYLGGRSWLVGNTAWAWGKEGGGQHQPALLPFLLVGL